MGWGVHGCAHQPHTTAQRRATPRWAPRMPVRPNGQCNMMDTLRNAKRLAMETPCAQKQQIYTDSLIKACAKTKRVKWIRKSTCAWSVRTSGKCASVPELLSMILGSPVARKLITGCRYLPALFSSVLLGALTATLAIPTHPPFTHHNRLHPSETPSSEVS